ncbi:MAG: hypothetical protein HKO56_09720, partial [Bacteroidia bacterium]|nr:hypothetical protein [Bacteroidia bacterium]NNM16924.1 hypothetical protein [Bacteroidia bacterium]
MKNILLVVLAISFAVPTQAQNKITLKDIWASGKFSPNYVYGLRSMQDGAHYTKTESGDDDATDIVKYAYA